MLNPSSAVLGSAAYTYDAASRLSTVSDGTNSATYSYVAYSSLVDHIVFAHNGSAVMTNQNTYDKLNRLAGKSSWLDFFYQYNAAGQRTQAALADGSYWHYGYDALGQLTNAVKYFSDATPYAGQQFGYGFDTIGNRLSTLAGGDSNGLNLRLAGYTNNALNQIVSRGLPGYVDVMGLTLATNTVQINGTNAYQKWEYFRKQLGTNNGSAPQWVGVTVTESNQTTVSGGVYLAQNPENCTYDADGNQLSDGRFNYTWDGENRLTALNSLTAAPSASKCQDAFAYDYEGRRIQKEVWTNNGNGYYVQSTNKYAYDGWNVVAILDGYNNLLYTFTWGTDLSGAMQGAGGVGGLLSMTVCAGTNAGTYFYCYDGNGNVVALVNAANGAVAANYEYGPFGELIRATGPMAKVNPFMFSSKFYDWETGLYYYGYRYYNPSTGRFINRDPSEEDGGPNLYDFVANDAMDFVDPDGRFLLAVDGTESINDTYNPVTRRWNSSVHNFYADYSGPGGKIVLQGPRLMGGDVPQIVKAGVHAVCSAVTRNPSEVVNMVGHSRGGLIVILVAKELQAHGCPCVTGVNINFMGLYDAVDRARAGSAEVISGNVDWVAHARRDPAVHSRSYFGNTGTSGGQNYKEKFFWGTHSAIGGDPWGGDHPSNVTQAQDNLAATQSDQWIRTEAKSHGVQVP